jgi:signal transduction histidine kinase
MVRARGDGIVAHSVLLSIVLVVATAGAVATALIYSLDRQVMRAADRRLHDGATLFLAGLEDTREDLLAVAGWMAFEPELGAAIRPPSGDGIEQSLTRGLRLTAVDEAVIADRTGRVLAGRRIDGLAVSRGTLATTSGFGRALAGDTVVGLGWDDDGSPEYELYRPLYAADGGQPVAVLRLSRFLNEAALDSFRDRTGLEISLFLGDERRLTTLRGRDGRRLSETGAGEQTVRMVMDEGRTATLWRDLPTGRVRILYTPLSDAEGRRTGMVATALPVATLSSELHNVLRLVLPISFVILLVGGVLAYRLGDQVQRPVLALAAAAGRLRAGDLSTPVPPVREPTLAPLAGELERARLSIQESVQAAAAEERRLENLFAAVPLPVIATAADGRVLAGNGPAQALFGDAARRPGAPITALLPFVAQQHRTGDAATVWQGEITDSSGRTVGVDVTYTTVPAGRLHLAGVYIVHDVSHYVALNHLREQLLYSVAHELRGPLAVLNTTLDLVSADYAGLPVEEMDRLLATARRTTLRIERLMEDLLSAGAIQAGRFTICCRPAPVAVLLTAAVEDMGTTLSMRGQTVDFTIEPHSLVVAADERAVRQVLVNLLSNASKYGPAGECITLRAERTEGAVRIAVEDRGPGIPAAQRAGLFERFYRLRPGAEEPGIGLGLAIAKGIVEAHGGVIGVESGPGEGTRVWFTLPVVQAAP